METENKIGVNGSWEEGEMGSCSMGIRFWLCKIKC